MRALQTAVFLTILFFQPFLMGLLQAQDQDVTAEEIEKAQRIKESLIRQGYLQVVLNDLPAFQSANVEPIIDDAWYIGKRKQVATNHTGATDFRPTGSRLYVVGRNNLKIFEYHLSSDWDIATANLQRELDVSDEMGSAAESAQAPFGLYIRKDDGGKMWVWNRTEIWEYTLSTPWNVSSATQTGYKDFSNQIVRGHDIDFKPDGTALYVDDRVLEVVFQFNLSSSWDVETASLDQVLDISDQQINVRGTQFSRDGKKVFFMDTGRREVLEYTVATPYEIETASFVGSFSVSSQASAPEGITFRPDLSNFYVGSETKNIVYQYMIARVDPDESSVTAVETEVEADGNDDEIIRVILRNEDGNRLPNLEVDLDASSNNTQIQAVKKFTDDDGEATFRVRNSTPERVIYSATVKRSNREVELTDKPEITFLPVAPVILSATDVEERTFTANWEMVSNVSNYRIDVATDNDFEEILDEYQSLDVGLVTDFKVENLNPGNAYYYRVRSESNGIIGNNSQVVEVITFPEIPDAMFPDNVSATRFIAQWQQAEGAEQYLLDVALDSDFTEFVPSYENVNAGNQLSYNVTNLPPGTTYYYRVRAKAFSRISKNSETINISTEQIGLNETELISSQLRVLANGEQANVITLFLRSPEGKSIENEKIELIPDNTNSEIEVLQGTTDENGQAIFSITSNIPGKVTYNASIEGIYEIGEISVEFLQNEGVLKLGANYPNPFRYQTTVPVTVPERMRIVITLSNILGASLKTIIDEEVEPGYYEIPVNLADLASGVYFYRMVADDEMKTKKMLMVR